MDAATQRWLRAHSVTVLHLSLGAVFLGFGVLEYFPGVSPAPEVAATTTRILTFGLLPDPLALVGLATLECAIGFCLLAGGRLFTVVVALLVPELAGILSPLVVLHGACSPVPPRPDLGFGQVEAGTSRLRARAGLTVPAAIRDAIEHFQFGSPSATWHVVHCTATVIEETDDTVLRKSREVAR